MWKVISKRAPKDSLTPSPIKDKHFWFTC